MPNRVPLYLGLTLAGAGGYYLYRAGGDPQGARQEAKHDVQKARDKLPTTSEAEKKGQEVGREVGRNVEAFD
ncbi:hypothetical protein ASPZODRAFT_127507, partial [Penicilliopsis zonata CBS 506.65]